MFVPSLVPRVVRCKQWSRAMVMPGLTAGLGRSDTHFTSGLKVREMRTSPLRLRMKNAEIMVGEGRGVCVGVACWLVCRCTVSLCRLDASDESVSPEQSPKKRRSSAAAVLLPVLGCWLCVCISPCVPSLASAHSLCLPARLSAPVVVTMLQVMTGVCCRWCGAEERRWV